MSKQLKLRRGTTAQHSTFTGASGEITVDTTKKTAVVHDGTTAGGTPLATEASVTSLTTTVGTKADASATTAALATKANDSAVVHLTGNETVAGVKTFSSSPVLPGNATTALQAVPKQQLDAFLPVALSTASGSAPSYSARAWVNFNGTGTVAIRGSGNVSSITDNGVGNYTVNFSTAMPDANYALGLSAGMGDGTGVDNRGPISPGTSGVQVQTTNNGQTAYLDVAYVSVTIFR